MSLESVILAGDALTLLFELLQIALLLINIAGHLALSFLKLVDLNLNRPDIALDMCNIVFRHGKRMLAILNCLVKLAAGALLLLQLTLKVLDLFSEIAGVFALRLCICVDVLDLRDGPLLLVLAVADVRLEAVILRKK